MVRTARAGSSHWWTLVLGIAGVVSAGETPAPMTQNRPQRNNNPLNVKYGSLTKHWVDSGQATLDPTPAQDGGRFLRFPDARTGLDAGQELLRSPLYRDQDLERALRRWSGGGYGADIAPSLRGKTIEQLSGDEIDFLSWEMAHREGYFEGGIPPSGADALIQSILPPIKRLLNYPESELIGNKPNHGARSGADAGRTPSPTPRRVAPINLRTTTNGALRGAEAGALAGLEPLTDQPVVRGEVAQFGSRRFFLPGGWNVAQTFEDGIMLAPDGNAATNRFINILRHPFGPQNGNSPAAVARQIIRTSWGVGGHAVLQRSVAVGTDKLPGAWIAHSNGNQEAVLFNHDGAVVMISDMRSSRGTGNDRDPFWQVVRSFGTNPEAALPPATPPTAVERPRLPEAGSGRPTTSAANTPNGTRSVKDALTWARGKQGSKEWDGLCLAFTRQAYDLSARFPSAEAARQHFEAAAMLQTSRWDQAPEGSWLFFRYEGQGNAGHVGISAGGDNIVDAFLRAPDGVQQRSFSSGPYAPWYRERFLGWVNPDDAVRLWTKP